MAIAIIAQIEEVQNNNQRMLVQAAVAIAVFFAVLGMLAIISATAVDVMTPSSLAESMVVDARSSIFRAG